MTLLRNLLLAGLALAALPAHASFVDFDTSFSGDGRAQHDAGFDYEETIDVYVAPSGLTYVLAYAHDYVNGWTANEHRVVMRLKANGALDTSFASGGTLKISLDDLYLANFGMTALLVDEAAKRIYFAGARAVSANGNYSHMAVARMTYGGVFDNSFGDGGIAVADAPPYAGGPYSYDNFAYRLTRLGDGSIVAMGVRFKIDADTKVALAKFSASGVPDTSFGGANGYNGFLVLDFGREDEYARGVVPGPNDTLVIDASSGDDTNTDLVVGRLTSGGLFDPSFSTDGWLADPLDTNLLFALAPRVASDGTITIAGSTLGPDFDLGNFIVRYTGTGARDGTFGTGGLLEEEASSFVLNGTFALHPDGKIVFGGSQYDESTGYDIEVMRLVGSSALAVPGGVESGGGGGALGAAALGLLGFAAWRRRRAGLSPATRESSPPASSSSGP